MRGFLLIWASESPAESFLSDVPFVGGEMFHCFEVREEETREGGPKTCLLISFSIINKTFLPKLIYKA